MKNTLIILLFLILNGMGCVKEHDVVRSFCYWKTGLYFQKEKDSLIDKMGMKHMYVRFFDVDWNPYSKEPLPISTIKNLGFN